MPSRVTAAAAAVTLLTTLAAPALATPTQGSWSSITLLSGGWTDPNMRISLTGAFLNPSGCAMTDGYIVEAALPGAQLLQSMLLTAYARGDEVLLTIDGCAYDRPRVIAVDIRKAP